MQFQPHSIYAIVHVRYKPGAVGELQSLTPMASFKRLVAPGQLHNTLILDFGMQAFLRWLEKADSYELEYNDFDRAHCERKSLL